LLPGVRSLQRGSARRRRLQSVLSRAAGGESKPTRTTLYTKAGPDGKSLGDCPFSHSVQMALRLKGVDFDIVPCTQETKPQWLLDEVDGKMPCVYHGGIPHVETLEILSWIEAEFTEPSLTVPDNLPDAASECFGLFPAIAKFTKNQDASQDEELRIILSMKLASLRAFIARFGGKFICGDEPTLLDCEVLPKLYVLEHSTAHYKNFSLEVFPVGDEVREYYERGSAMPAFTESTYPKDVGIWGWGQARGGS